jgi:hypothetical protein
MLGETSGLVLAPNLGPVDVDVEYTAPAANQLSVNVEFLLDRFRQTGSFRKVVSFHAVLNAHMHPSISM